jgi:hypothetical protein
VQNDDGLGAGRARIAAAAGPSSYAQFTPSGTDA